MHKKCVIFVTAIAALVGLLLGCPGPTVNGTDGGTDGGMTYAPGSQGFLQSCDTAVDCETLSGADAGYCIDYPAKGGNLCSKPCTPATASTDCPAPSTGCNGMGYCKAP